VAEGSGIWTPGGERPTGAGPQPGSEPQELTPEQLVEQIKRLRVSDVLLSTISTVAQLGYVKLEASSRDLEQARLAIETLRAVVPLLEGFVPAETVRDFTQVVANLQLAYASAVGEASKDVPEEPAEAEGEPREDAP
jgi:hypothetical protein